MTKKYKMIEETPHPNNATIPNGGGDNYYCCNVKKHWLTNGQLKKIYLPPGARIMLSDESLNVAHVTIDDKKNNIEEELERVTADAQRDQDTIRGLSIDLSLAERTIARLVMNETVAIEMDAG